MSDMVSVQTDSAPSAIGPYSQAVMVDGWLFCSGQIPIDPTTGEIVGGDIGVQTDQVLKNLSAVLEAAGASLSRVVKTTVFLADMGDFSGMNEVYAAYFQDHRPARAAVAVSRRCGAKSFVVQHGVPLCRFGFAPPVADHVLVWGRSSAEKLMQWNVQPGQIRITGWPTSRASSPGVSCWGLRRPPLSIQS